MCPSTEESLAAIAADRAHGAAQLAALGLEVLARACTEHEGPGGEALLNSLVPLVRRLAALRPSMAAPGNWALAFWHALRERLEKAPQSSAAQAGESIAAELRSRQASHTARIVAGARPILRQIDCLLTLSYSSTIEAVLREAASADCRIIVAESRPLFEGRILVERLRESGRDVKCITDAQLALGMREAKMLLLGADSVCADLAAINKVGSLSAALAAQRFGKPCAVATDTYKVSGTFTSTGIVLEEGPGEEVWPEAADICGNVYFENVPADLLTFYITEKGVRSHRALRDEVKRWKRLWEAFPSRGEPE